MGKIGRALEAEGYEVFNIGYPSTKYNNDDNVKKNFDLKWMAVGKVIRKARKITSPIKKTQ
jgi:hypothetical protein